MFNQSDKGGMFKGVAITGLLVVSFVGVKALSNKNPPILGTYSIVGVATQQQLQSATQPPVIQTGFTMNATNSNPGKNPGGPPPPSSNPQDFGKHPSWSNDKNILGKLKGYPDTFYKTSTPLNIDTFKTSTQKQVAEAINKYSVMYKVDPSFIAAFCLTETDFGNERGIWTNVISSGYMGPMQMGQSAWADSVSYSKKVGHTLQSTPTAANTTTGIDANVQAGIAFIASIYYGVGKQNTLLTAACYNAGTWGATEPGRSVPNHEGVMDGSPSHYCNTATWYLRSIAYYYKEYHDKNGIYISKLDGGDAQGDGIIKDIQGVSF